MFIDSGFSMIDLVEDRRNRQLFALKRILCHSEQDEKDGMREVQYMEMFNHSNLAPCEAYSIVPVKSHMTAISELFIVMPYYKVRCIFWISTVYRFYENFVLGWQNLRFRICWVVGWINSYPWIDCCKTHPFCTHDIKIKTSFIIIILFSNCLKKIQCVKYSYVLSTLLKFSHSTCVPGQFDPLLPWWYLHHYHFHQLHPTAIYAVDEINKWNKIYSLV